MGKVNLKAQLEAVIGVKACPLEVLALAFAHFHRTFDANKALGRFLQLNASALQQKHKGGRRAIKNRHFLSGDIDIEVVDTKPCDGRHQVLDRMHFGTTSTNGRSHTRIGHGFSRNRNIHRLRQIHPTKHDAGIRLGRAQCQLDTLAAVQAHAYGTGNGLDGALLKHGSILNGTTPSRHSPTQGCLNRCDTAN